MQPPIPAALEAKKRGVIFDVGHGGGSFDFSIAEAALAETEDADVNSNTAYLYEIKARASLQRELPDRERHLAHAIALHLAVGEDDIARELADYFRPSFSHDEQGGVDSSLDQKVAMPQQSL